jgi:hypothetical protein
MVVKCCGAAMILSTLLLLSASLGGGLGVDAAGSKQNLRAAAALNKDVPLVLEVVEEQEYLEQECPVDKPDSGGTCSIEEGMQCEYDFINMPTINKKGRCKKPFTCSPTAGCTCSEGSWQCWSVGVATCAKKKKPPPKKTHQSCEPKVQEEEITTTEKDKTSWPELIGLSGEAAKVTLEEENPGMDVEIVPDEALVITDYREDRIRIYTDAKGTVYAAPIIG